MTLMKITYRSIVFIALLILIDQIVGILLDEKYQANTCFYSNGEVNDYIQNKKCDTLFVGSSRVLHMIDASLLGPNSMNLAKEQKHNHYQTSIIDILAQNNKLPRKLLVLNLEGLDLFMEYGPSLIEQVNSLSYYYSSNEIVKSYINKQGWQERIKFLSHTYRHNSIGLQLFTNPLENVCPEYPLNGYIALTPTALDSARLAKSLIDDFTPIKNQRFNKLVFENIIHIKSLCDKKSIQLIIIDAPYYKNHPSFKKASSTLQKFCEKIDVKFIDFKYEEIPGLENKLNWYDNMHTNEKGSEIYTRFLKEKISAIN